jgi:hypothetical protein
MATVISAFVKYLWVHPVISARLDEHRGSYGPLMDIYRADASGNIVGKHKGRYLRLNVKNNGLSSIKDCSGYITQITKRVGGTQSDSRQEVIDLGWAHQQDNSNQRDIPRGAFFHLDVCSLQQYPGPDWRLQLPRGIPTTLSEFLSDAATYRFTVLIAADNARPRSIDVEFTFDPKSDELKPVWVTKTKYPWWAFWRWFSKWWPPRR